MCSVPAPFAFEKRTWSQGLNYVSQQGAHEIFRAHEVGWIAGACWMAVRAHVDQTNQPFYLLQPLQNTKWGARKISHIFRSSPSLRHTHTWYLAPNAGCPSLKLGYFERSQSVLPARFYSFAVRDIFSATCFNACDSCMELADYSLPLAYLALVDNLWLWVLMPRPRDESIAFPLFQAKAPKVGASLMVACRC